VLRGVIRPKAHVYGFEKKTAHTRMGTEVLETVKPTRLDMAVLEDQGASN